MMPSLRTRTARVVVFILFLTAIYAVAVSAEPIPMDESQIRAMVIINLTKYIDWPPSRSDLHSSFLICVAGNDPVGIELERMLVGGTIQGRPVVVRREVAPDQSEACHILYLAHQNDGHLSAIAAHLASASVLTISQDRQGRSGTVIGLPLVDGHVQIEINRPLAQRSSLALSSHLLKIASGGQ